MWLVISEFTVTTLAVIFCGLAIKLTDDWIDQEQDGISGQKNWATIIGIGTMLYAMLLLIIAAAIRADISLPLFLASYVVGMFHDLTSRFPLGLSGWQESLIVLIISLIFFSHQQIIFSLLFVVAVQLFDDWYDFISDSRGGQRNFAVHFGRIECFLLATLCFFAACWMNEILFYPVLAGTIIVSLIVSNASLVK